MTINALGALILLSRVISVKFEYNSVKNIVYASGIMGIFLLIIHVLLPITHIVSLIAIVIVGAVIYMIALFYLDRKIYYEIRELSFNLGIRWPGRL
jgi:uncharacterized membrane-anchored protein